MRFEEGPIEMLAALASGDPERIEAAKIMQHELFREAHGCYLWEMTEVCPECGEEDCRTWAPLRQRIASHDEADSTAARLLLRETHARAE